MSDPRETNGNRTHEPNLRELTAELDGIKNFLEARLNAVEKLAEKRDEWYTERDKDRQASVDKALTAAKEQTKGSFDASEKAIVKAEEAQKSYNQSHNDLSRKLEVQNQQTMPRLETESRFSGVEEKIVSLRDQLTDRSGMVRGGKIVKDENRANVAIIVAAIAILVELARTFIGK